MRYLVRRMGAGGASRDEEHETAKLTLGSGRCLVALPQVSGRLTFEALDRGRAKWRTRGMSLRVGGQPLAKGTAEAGDRLELPGYTVELAVPPQGFDLMVRVAAADIGAAVRYGGESDFAMPGRHLRKIAWLSAAVVLAATFLLPAMPLWLPETEAFLAEVPLPSDGIWSTGPLAAAHQALDVRGDCRACHSRPFSMVQDDACLACHADVNDHEPVPYGVDDERLRCAECHREHNEPPLLVRHDSELCVTCHRDIEPVLSFTVAGHPPFRLALLTPPPEGGDEWEAMRWDGDAVPLETSNLEFSHALHLSGEAVARRAEQRQIEWGPDRCDTCHRREANAEHFEPITLERHCRACHELGFSPRAPDLQLPHGDVGAARAFMEDHFFRVLVEGEKRGARGRRGRNPTQAVACPAGDRDCARREASRRADDQFDVRCGECHSGRDGRDDVLPVKLADDWYPYARFDHASHSTQQCMACHNAQDSKQSADVLIPNRDTCMPCHSAEVGDVHLACVDCHAYHPRVGAGHLVSEVRRLLGSSAEGAHPASDREP